MKFKRLRPLLANFIAHGDRLGIVSMSRWFRMDKLRHSVLPVLFEAGENPSVLIIAFTGNAQKFDIPVFQFFEMTQTLGYSRILLQDSRQMFYHYGIDRKRRDWPALLDYLRNEVARLEPKTVFCVGTSSGGYAAMVAGHYLRADYVHAFGPQTKIDTDKKAILSAPHPVKRWRLSRSKRTFREILDLAPMLGRSNGKTVYYVHYCAGHALDREFIARIAGLPSVFTIGYPCTAHAVAIFLAKKKFLQPILDVANQPKLVEIARAYFGDQLRVEMPNVD